MGIAAAAPWIQAGAQAAGSSTALGMQRLGANYDRKQQLKTQEAMMGLQMKYDRMQVS